jgi:putative transposase
MAETSVSRWPRSGSVSSPAAWLSAQMIRRRTLRPWSSYLTTCAQADAPPWLQTHWMLGQFSPRRSAAIAKYVSFVHEGARLPGVWTQLRGQIYLGSEAFVQRMQARIEKQANLSEIPRAQRRAITQPLELFAKRYARDEAMARAYFSGQHTMAARPPLLEVAPLV